MKYALGLLALLVFGGLSGCYTMKYRMPVEPNGQAESQWYHTGIFGLVEYSDPVRAKNFCKDGVRQVQHRVSPLQAVIWMIPYVNAVWTPLEVKFECSDTEFGSANSSTNSSGGGSNTNTNTQNQTNNQSQNVNVNINITPELLEKLQKKKAADKPKSE